MPATSRRWREPPACLPPAPPRWHGSRIRGPWPRWPRPRPTPRRARPPSTPSSTRRRWPTSPSRASTRTWRLPPSAASTTPKPSKPYALAKKLASLWRRARATPPRPAALAVSSTLGRARAWSLRRPFRASPRRKRLRCRPSRLLLRPRRRTRSRRSPGPRRATSGLPRRNRCPWRPRLPRNPIRGSGSGKSASRSARSWKASRARRPSTTWRSPGRSGRAWLPRSIPPSWTS